MIHPPPDPPSLRIRYLADHPEVLGSLAAGFKAQWPSHFADLPVDSIKLEFGNCCRDSGLPLAVVAILEQGFGGTASLRAESGTVCRELGPWLTHLYVEPHLRNRGIGTALIRAVEAEAVRHGFTELFAATARAALVFERLGWHLADAADHQGDRIQVMRKRLEETA
jgi:GNAT superfamily N-acetyltransferase